MNIIDYTPPPTLKEFIKDYLPGQLFYDWIIGPVGSGKTTGIFMKLVVMAGMQAPGPDGIRRTRAVIVRNTMNQLRDTTLSSWNYWFKPGQAGTWEETKKLFTLRFGDIECEVMFRALDTPQDVARVLSLEVSFVVIDEFVEIPEAIINALSARCGRYPSKVMGGCTNWGMWGSSNPSTEDNWWHDKLHNAETHVQPGKAYREADTRNARYFKQPSGFSDNAENLENLPGGIDYYHNQAKDKSEAWIFQFLKSEWGFSVAGKPVVATFRSNLHVSQTPLTFNPHLDLVAGFDPGLGGSAFIFGQEDLDGRLLVLGEIVNVGYGVSRLISEKLRPYLRNYFPDLNPERFIIAPDPAASIRGGNDEKTAIDILKRADFNVSYESNNRLPLRLDALEHFTTKLVDGRPGFLIDGEKCPMLVRALKGGWRWSLDKNEQVKGEKPEKNAYSHPGDASGYLARYYHRQSTRNQRYVLAGGKPFSPPRTFGGASYHVGR